MTEKLLTNWPVKLICLVVAIFIYIFHQTSLVERKNFVVPLEVIEDGQVMNVDSIPNSITLSVRALSDDMSDIHTEDFSAKLDLSTIAESGEFDVPIQVTISDSLKKLESLEIRIRPSSTIKVKVEEKIVKFIPLEASVSGEPASGYSVESVTLEPSSVSVVGPSSIVNKIEKLYTDKVLVSNAKTNFSTEVNYLSINKMILVEDKGPYKATVVISPLPLTKTYENVSISPINLNENYVLNENLPSATITVDGTVPTLENYELSKNAVYVDFSQISSEGSYELPVSVYFPSSLRFSVKSISPQSVKVNIVKKYEIPNEEIEDFEGEPTKENQTKETQTVE